jgi:zinc/manganese transport system permease protein
MRCLGANRGGVAGDGGLMSAHALIVEPFETLAFMRAALVACLALAVVNGVVGTLLVMRRMTLDGDVLGHAVMPGAAVGFLYAGPSPTWLALGGLASGLAVAALAGLMARERAQRDIGLVVFYLIALSLGVALVAQRGSNVDVMRVLFGTVLAIDHAALLQIAAVTSFVVLVVAILYRPLVVSGFDPAFLRAVGTRTPYRAVFSLLWCWRWSRAFRHSGPCSRLGRCCSRRRRRDAGAWEWLPRWDWRPVLGRLHPWSGSSSLITPTCRPVRRSC